MIRLFQIVPLFLVFSSLYLQGQAAKDGYAAASVLSSGKWFKIALTVDGIYRIEFTKLKQLGLEDPANPRIFGNNAGQLSYFNDNSAPDDLKEIAIFTSTGNDGIFNEGDFLLFYGQGTHRWIFDKTSAEFDFKRHNYSDTAFYFITSGAAGKKVSNTVQPATPPNSYSSASDALFIHEIESENLIQSGREWYQPMTYTRDLEIDPGFKDLITTEPMKFSVRLLARSPVASSFNLSSNGSLLQDIPVAAVNTASTTGTYAQAVKADGQALPPSGSPVFKVKFLNNGETSAKAWIDYLKIAARTSNTFNGLTTPYIDSKSAGPGTVTEFTIKSSVDGINIWDVTDPLNPTVVQYIKSGGEIRFKSATDSLRTFVAFITENVQTPVIATVPVPNQDLHSSSPADMVIVTHPLFIDYALKLAQLHKTNSGLTSLVVTPRQIYNEFSGGVPDIAAIRNFLRMKFLKQTGSSHPLKYLLLFGDGSYENKTPPPGNTDFIPTWQTQNSNIIISSFSSDDFYGLLEEGEGEDSGTEDIGIGRLPVSDTLQAGVVLSKITGYLDPSNRGGWKNNILLVADDEDGNTHMSDAEGLADILADSVPWANVGKIYFDAYNQVTTATGQFYPDVTKAINERINSGTLIFNYIGHGNESGLGHERVLTAENIDIWKNKTKLPLFITATCEFSRFDDVGINPVTREFTGKSSAGEKILLKPDGGAIALMSTTRLVYSAPNYLLNRNIFSIAFESDAEGKALRLGDIIRIAKNRSGSGTNKRNFALLGDPAVRLSYPWYGNIVTDSVNGVSITEPVDTLKALSTLTITGHIEDLQGNLMNDFNGEVLPVIYDKASLIETLANDGGQKMKFSIQNNILFSGRTMARKGKFSFTFLVPREIDYTYGNGKISYYATDSVRDFKGSFNRIIAGGFTNISGNDTTGPEIRLFLNDTLFRSGGTTDRNPRLLALISDNGGVNTTGWGLGHDLESWLDSDRSNHFLLNNYFENDYGTSLSGKVIYDFSDLPARNSHIIT